jgi:hypothetical protein
MVVASRLTSPQFLLSLACLDRDLYGQDGLAFFSVVAQAFLFYISVVCR